MYKNGSAYFADFIRLLLQIKDEVLGESTWSTTSNFEERVLKRFASNGRVHRLMIKMSEFNKNIDTLKKLLKEKDENEKKEEVGKNKERKKVEGKRKDGDEKEYKKAQILWEELEKHQKIEGLEEENEVKEQKEKEDEGQYEEKDKGQHKGEDKTEIVVLERRDNEIYL